MGCSSATKVNEEEDYTRKLGGVTGSRDIISILEEITPNELNQISEFNDKITDKEGLKLSNISFWSYKIGKDNNFDVSYGTNNYFNCLKYINPFNSQEIYENKDISILTNNLLKIEEKYTDKIFPIPNNYFLNISQKIFAKYKFILKLKNIKDNTYKVFDYNNIDRPLLVIVFDILSNEAIFKIKKIKEYEDELKENENKNFLLIPIINAFTNEKDNITNMKKIIDSLDISDIDCYIMINGINNNLIKLFQLDEIRQSKCIFVNRNSEISFMLKDQIEYLTNEMIDFYLNIRDSQQNNRLDYFNYRDKILIKDFFVNNKENLKLFTKYFYIEVMFREINIKSMPLHINFTYNQKDNKIAELLIENLTNELKGKIKKFFIAENIIKTNLKEILTTLSSFKRKINKEIYYLSKSKITYKSFYLICKNKISNFNKDKKYILNFNIDNILFYDKTQKFLNDNIYNNSKLSNLNCGYSIIPNNGIKINKILNDCKEIKLFKTLKSQNKFNQENKIINFDLNENQIGILFLLNIDYFIKNESEKNKIKNIFEDLFTNNIKFVIILIANNEIDCQKLRYLQWENIYYNKSKDKKCFNILYINKNESKIFSNLCYYNENINFKMMNIDSGGYIAEIIDLDFYNNEDFTMEKIQNRDFFNYLTFLKEKYSNNLKKKNEKFKEIKSKIIDIFKNVEENSKNSNIFKSFNYNLNYEKVFYFNDENNINEYNIQYDKIIFNFIYIDYIRNKINLNLLKSYMNKDVIEFNEVAIKSDLIINEKTKKFRCIKCKNSFKIEGESFYLCLSCKDCFICKNCYGDLLTALNSNLTDGNYLKKILLEDNEINNNNDNDKEYIQNYLDKIHGHPLLFIFNYTENKNSCIISELFEKYSDIYLTNKQIGKNETVSCSCCGSYFYKDFRNLNIVLSYIKNDNGNIADNSKKYGEIIVCNDCIYSKKFKNMCEKEIIDNENNLIFIKSLTF